MNDWEPVLKKEAWENWRFQVNSGWNRSNYFVLFETGALTGVWQLLTRESAYHFTALVFTFFGLLSAIIWLLNDLINHKYILYWWTLAIPNGFDYNEDARLRGIDRWWSCLGLKYSHLMHVIPILFCFAWAVTFYHFCQSRLCCVLAALGGIVVVWGILAIFKDYDGNPHRPPVSEMDHPA